MTHEPEEDQAFEPVPENARPGHIGVLSDNPALELTTIHDCYWVDHGIQKTGERVLMCRDCPAGMEVDPAVTVADGQAVFPAVS